MIRADYKILIQIVHVINHEELIGFEKTVPKNNNNMIYDGNKENTER
jgi:hypothetical protein